MINIFAVLLICIKQKYCKNFQGLFLTYIFVLSHKGFLITSCRTFWCNLQILYIKQEFFNLWCIERVVSLLKNFLFPFKVFSFLRKLILELILGIIRYSILLSMNLIDRCIASKVNLLAEIIFVGFLIGHRLLWEIYV